MSTNILEKKAEEIKIEVKVSAKEFEGFIEEAYQKTKSKYAIQGFRKGKVPRAIIEKNYGEEVFFEDAINEALSHNYADFLKANEDVVPFTWPVIEVKEAGKKGMVATLSIPLTPTIELGNYKSLKVKTNVNNVSEEELQKALVREQEKMARLVPVERKSKSGDVVNLNYEGFIDDVAFDGGKADNYDLTLGSGQFIPGFEDQLIGLTAGESKDIEVTFPEQYGEPKFAGKKAIFKCLINDVKEKVLPELNDEFAKDVSEFLNIDDYKDSIKKELENQKERQASIELENKIVEKIIEGSKFTIAPAVIDEEVNFMMQDLEKNLAMQGLTLENYLQYVNLDEKAFKDGRKKEAERMIKTRLVFTEIIKKENITVNEDDCIANLLRQNKGLVKDSAKTYFTKLSPDRQNSIRNDAMIDKILNLLKNENA